MSSYPTASTLSTAGKTYSDCARKIENRGRYGRVESAQLIGLGAASDMVRRAAHLAPLDYTSRKMRKSSRKEGLDEIVRFNLCWTALNAIFSRDSLLSLIATSQRSEYSKFVGCFSASRIPRSSLVPLEQELHNALDLVVATRMPGSTTPSTEMTLKVLHAKYTPSGYRTLGVGRSIAAAIRSGTAQSLDVPTMVYAIRNWIFHGSLVDSGFGGTAKFRKVMKAVIYILALTHKGTSKKLLSAL